MQVSPPKGFWGLWLAINLCAVPLDVIRGDLALAVVNTLAAILCVWRAFRQGD